MLSQVWTNTEPYISTNEVECKEHISSMYPEKEDEEEGMLRTDYISKTLTSKLNL